MLSLFSLIFKASFAFAVVSGQNIYSSSSNDVSNDPLPVRAKYVYEGPEGCSPETCSCRLSNSLIPGESYMLKTTSCKPLDEGTYVILRVPQPILTFMSNLKSWRDNCLTGVGEVISRPQDWPKRIWYLTVYVYHAVFDWGKPKNLKKTAR